MSDDIIVVGSVDKSPIVSPPLKKLKQSRLPFAPINTKSPKQNETGSTEKKRKHSGSEDTSCTSKTPRSESKEVDTPDENLVTLEDGESVLKEESPGDQKVKEGVKKRGRVAGVKVKSKDDSLSSPQGDGSPVTRKRGRPSGSSKLSSDLNKSIDLNKSLQGEDEKSALAQNSTELTPTRKSKKEKSVVEKYIEDSSCEKVLEKAQSSDSASHKPSQDGSSGDAAEKSIELSNDESGNIEEKEVKSDKDNSADSTEEGKSEIAEKKRGRPKQSLTPQEKDTPKRKRGRPFGSKNIRRDDSQTSLNRSVCSNPSDDESHSLGCSPIASKKEQPVEKTRKLLALFASSSASLSSQTKKGKVTETNDGAHQGKITSYAEKKGNVGGKIKSNIKETEGNMGKERAEVDPKENDEINDKIEKEDEITEVESKDDKKVRNPKEIESKDKIKERKTGTTSKSSPGKTKKVIVKKSNIKETEGNIGKERAEVDPKENDEINDKIEKIEKEDEITEVESKDDKKVRTPKEIESKDKIKKIENKDEKSIDDSGNETNEQGEKEKETVDNHNENENCIESSIKDKNKAEKCELAVKKNVNERVKDVKENSKNEDESNEAEESKQDCDESVNDLDMSNCESEGNVSKSPSSTIDAGKSPSSDAKTPSSSGPKSLKFTNPKKLTPLQKEREAAKLLKMEEREKQKQERERQLQEKTLEKEKQRKEREEEKKQKDDEKQKQKEEREKAKEELRKKRQEEIDAKKQKKEEELQKKEEERLQKEEERLKKEEERLKKDEEKLKKVEEQRKQKDKLKNKFASFFVSKKREAGDEYMDSEGPFQQFRIKEDMLLAPIVRHMLSESQVSELDKCISGKKLELPKTYLKVLMSETYIRHKSERTWPCIREPDVEEDDDVRVIDDDDDDEEGEMGDYSAMIQDPRTNMVEGKGHKAKYLLFCENRRPAYWGTWSKKSSTVSSRRPFSKDEVFDYEYDSDNDWEEEEAGESLSDSEGEDKDEKEEGDQYEVDNDFFVPHGYLSDDEGKSDQEEEEEAQETNNSKDTERSRNTEQLKLKQAEFEEEMKKKTKQLKPRLIGCLWMADENNNPAYDQLMKILGPHKAVTLCSQLPIGSRHMQGLAKETKETDVEDDNAADYRIGNSKRFVKAFPEEAIPALIKMLHGNRHGKTKLCREFGDYWRKLTGGELEDNMINHTPVKTPVSGSVHISKRKVEEKIKELGTWKRCLDDRTTRHLMCWYVPKKVREEQGLADLELHNSWIYINNPVKEKKEEVESEEDTPKINKMRPITAFAKKIPSTPSSTNTSPSSTPSTTPLLNQLSKMDGSPSLSGPSADSTSKILATPSVTNGVSLRSTPSTTPDTLLGKQTSSGKKTKKKMNLFPAKSQETSGPQKGSIASFFKMNKGNSPQFIKVKPDNSKDSSTTSEEIITLD